MQNSVASLLTQFSPRALEQEALRAGLNGIIDRLEQRQQTLEDRLSTETRDAELRHLKISLEVGRRQLKKALTLRTNLTSTQEGLHEPGVMKHPQISY